MATHKADFFTLDEVNKLKIIQDVVDRRLTTQMAAQRFGLSDRQCRRLIERYRNDGPLGLTSRRRGKPSNNQLSKGLAAHALNIIREHYVDFGPTLACEKLSDIDYAWAYSDDLIIRQIPDIGDANFLVVLTNVPLEGNWYSRRLGNNKVIFTFHEIKDYLLYENIPLENVVYRILYAYSLVYMRSGHRIPDYGEAPGFTHDETKGCLFDMNGIKSDLIESCNKPIICRECEYKLTNAMVPNNVIENIKHELKSIKKPLYYIWLDFIKVHPVISIVISSFTVILLGIIGL